MSQDNNPQVEPKVDSQQADNQEPKAPEKVEEPKTQDANPTLEALADLKKEVSEIKESESQRESALDEYKQKQQQEAIDFFKDETKKKQLLSGMSQEEANGLLKGIEQGVVTRRELEVRAQLGFQKASGPKENVVVPVNNKADSIAHVQSIEQINGERMKVIRDMRHPYHDPRHKDHAAAVSKMAELEKRRDTLEAQAGN